MENKLEQLLNSLIDKGWLPRWESEPIYMLSSKKLYIPDTMEVNRSLRDLVSKESWLWQFVCENGMVYETPDDRWWPNYNWLEDLFNCWWKCPDYWLMESALCDEDKLEDFILSNIKVDVESK